MRGVGDPAGGGRRELWAPRDGGSAQPAERPLYGVPIPTRRRSLGRPRISRRPLLPQVLRSEETVTRSPS